MWRTTPDTNSGCGGTPPRLFRKLSTRRSRDFKINQPPNAFVSEPERSTHRAVDVWIQRPRRNRRTDLRRIVTKDWTAKAFAHFKTDVRE